MGKGKILKIKKGYNPNCSSGMWSLALLFSRILIFGITSVASIVFGIVIYKLHIKKETKKFGNQLLDSIENES